MLPGGGILPSGVFRTAQVQGSHFLCGAVDDLLHIDARHSHGQQTHGGQHAVPAAHVIGNNERLPTICRGKVMENSLAGVGDGGDAFFRGGSAVFCQQQTLEHSECQCRL